MLNFPTFLADLGKTFGFSKTPSEPKDFDLKEGITFEDGSVNGTPVSKLVLHNQLLYAETVISTNESRKVLLHLLNWSRDAHSLTYEPSFIQRWAFISNVMFSTDFALLDYQSPVLREIAARVSDEIASNLLEHLTFTPGEIKLAHDPQKRSAQIAPFMIQHRSNTPYEQNVFYSEAPVPTHVHVELLELFEAQMRTNYQGQ